jgi:MFS family permease
MENEPKAVEELSTGQKIKTALKEVSDTFGHLIKAPRALWGINISYVFEGLAYFGVLTILGKYLSEDVGMSDTYASLVYSVFTGGITFSMLFLGGVSDKIGVRKALLAALLLMVAGRGLLGASGTFFEYGNGVGSPMFLTLAIGLMFVVVGYGMYQPAAYAGVKAFTNKKTAAVGFAMLYALMNLGAFFSGIISPPVRQSTGMVGVYWVFAGFTLLALLAVFFILTKRVIQIAEARCIEENKQFAAEEQGDQEDAAPEKSKETDGAAKKPQRPLLEPVVLLLSALVLLGLGGLIYQMFTVQPPAQEQAMGDHALFASAEPVDEASIDSNLAVPEGADGSAFATAMTKVRTDRELFEAVSDAPESTVAASEADVAQAKDVLRVHGITAMVAAYAQVDVVDDQVLDGLCLRYKEVEDDGPIPLDDTKRAAILSMAAAPPQELLTAYATIAQATNADLKRILGQEADPIVSGIASEISFARALATGFSDPGQVGKEILKQEFIGWFTAAFDQARALVAEPDTENPLTLSGLAGIKLEAQASSSKAIASSLPAATGDTLTTKLVSWMKSYGFVALPLVFLVLVLVRRLLKLRPDHPFNNGAFTFFIFILIPVQTLFAHNWLTLPYYINRAFGGTPVGDNFEFFSNLNPILIFVLTPLIAVFTASSNIYRMMLWGTLIMAAPTFLLVLPASPIMLLVYILLMTIGEAMWQPRFLQLVAEIAPEGKTGAYMGIAQLPWFLTKVVTGFYSGAVLSAYCPNVGPQNTEVMWLLYACIAMISPVALFFARGWLGKFLEKGSM